MQFKSKKNVSSSKEDIIELTPGEADAIIASGTSAMLIEHANDYDYIQNHQIQSLLNKLHGK